MNEATILYLEPQRIADWKDGMYENSRNGTQQFSPKYNSIRFVVSCYKSREEGTLSDKSKEYLKEYVKNDDNGLGDEIKAMFPELF